jgi:hypothetical protein
VIEAMKDRPSGVSHRKSLRRSKLVVLNMNAFEDCESYDLRLLSNGHLQFNSEEKKNIPFSEIRERFTETSKFVCDLYVSYHSLTHSLIRQKLTQHERQQHRYVSFRHDTFRKHAMRRCWSFIILPCRSSDKKVEICVLTKAQNKFWHGRDPIEATPRSKDALKLSCFGPECKSRACQFFGFGMCRRVSCSFEHVRSF